MKNRRQAAALDKLHRVVMNAAVASNSEDGHDVRMVQLRSGLSLDLEPLPLLGVDRRREREHFQSHPPTQRDLLGLVHDAHAATSDLAQNSIFTKLGRRGDRLGEMRRARLTVGKLRGGRLDKLQAGKTLAEHQSDIRMPGQELVTRSGVARPKFLEVDLECRNHTRIIPRETADRHVR